MVVVNSKVLQEETDSRNLNKIIWLQDFPRRSLLLLLIINTTAAAAAAEHPTISCHIILLVHILDLSAL